MHKALFTVCFLVGTFPLGMGHTVKAQTILLDDFETTDIRVVNPGLADPQSHNLWNGYQGEGGIGLTSITTETSFDGKSSLQARYTAGNLYLQLFTHKEVSNSWKWMREYVQPPEDWQMDTFNRMKFWIKVPPGITKESSGQSNVEFGTYIRKSTGDPTSAESGGNHYYHLYNLFSTGEWHQVIIDMHPNHIRGTNGGMEHGLLQYPTGETGFNYFDAMTRLYINYPYVGPESYPANYYVDGFSLYRETRQENVDQVYSLNGVFVPSSNKITVGWMRDKDENTVKHEVRYAFADIHDSGWNAATPAPEGIITPLGWQGYNGMEYETTGIDVSGKNTIYLAIKPENSSIFRQIAIPTSMTSGATPPPNNSDTTPPASPTNIIVQ